MYSENTDHISELYVRIFHMMMMMMEELIRGGKMPTSTNSMISMGTYALQEGMLTPFLISLCCSSTCISQEYMAK